MMAFDLRCIAMQFLVDFRAAHPGNHGQDSVAMAGVFLPFVPIQIVTATRRPAEPIRRQQERKQK